MANYRYIAKTSAGEAVEGIMQAESEAAVKTLTSAMEPIIIIVLAVGVGFMVVAIIMPIYGLTNQF